MNRHLTRITMAVAVGSLFVFSSCDEDPPLPDNLTNFEAAELGMDATEEELTININLTREAEADGTITVNFVPSGVEYGTDFTTEPAAANNSFDVAVPVNATSVSFKVTKAEGVLLDGDETITFAIGEVSPTLVAGETNQLNLTFSEILSATGELEVTGGGSTYPNKVFIDLSANRQTSVARTVWDLGFSSGDEFRVILNSSNGMMARALEKNDLASVTAADTVGFGAQLSLAAVFAAINQPNVPEWVAEAHKWIDHPTGDLTQTAIASVSATATENKVYIINRGTGPGANQPALGWKKIRIARNGSNYTLQHADINSATFSELQITKNTNFRFQYVSFGNGAVTVEPEKTKWDVAWTGFANLTDFGSGPVPYYFQDIILQNTSGAETVQVLESTTSYDTFSEANLAGLTFASSQVAIGSSWRSGGGPGTAPAIRADRYYIIKDPEGNYYKLKFTALTTNGERGKPQFKYALVKKAS